MIDYKLSKKRKEGSNIKYQVVLIAFSAIGLLSTILTLDGVLRCLF